MVVRRIDENKEIIIDFMVKEKLNPFEGRQEGIIYSILEGRTAEKTCRGEVPVHVPKRAPLAFLKMKAAWDRKYRVDHGTSHDETWERGKIEKDRCDIMALADPSGGGREIDLREFAELAHPYPFLLEVLEQVKEDQNAIRRYRKMNPREVAEVVDVLIDQAWS
jgi:hypothetical protein